AAGLLEQARLHAGEALRRRQAEVLESLRRQHPPARRALDEALLDEIGLDDLFDRVARLAQPRRDRLDADRPAAVVLGDVGQIPPVEHVEPALIDVEPEERLVGDLAGYRFG